MHFNCFSAQVLPKFVVFANLQHKKNVPPFARSRQTCRTLMSSTRNALACPPCPKVNSYTLTSFISKFVGGSGGSAAGNANCQMASQHMHCRRVNYGKQVLSADYEISPKECLVCVCVCVSVLQQKICLPSYAVKRMGSQKPNDRKSQSLELVHAARPNATARWNETTESSFLKSSFDLRIARIAAFCRQTLPF